jgi:hypothetical protein
LELGNIANIEEQVYTKYLKKIWIYHKHIILF